MSIFIKQEELETLRRAPEESRQRRLYGALKNRILNRTRCDRLVQPGDTQEWYHLVWERMSDASFVWAIEKEDGLGKWIHDRTMEIVSMSDDEWIGPWFRYRNSKEPPRGALETAHITLAVCEAYENCRELFSKEEQEAIRTVLMERGIPMCRRFCERVVAGESFVNNWFIVILDGFGTAAFVLGKKTEIEQALLWSDFSAKLYDERDYGESLQYSNYSSIHLSHLNEVACRCGISAERLNLCCYTQLMPWYAASFLYVKPVGSMDCPAPRSFNFGDSAAVFRPSGDVLAQVAARMAKTHLRDAGLARWLLDAVYSDDICPTLGELASFGFYNQYQYLTVLLYPQLTDPISPLQAGLSEAMCFDGGHILVRDQIERPRAAVALSAGYKQLNVTAHRHRDQGSFQLVIGKERMLVDPGHCCYRLAAQRKSIDESSHNTISLTRGGAVISQKLVAGSFQQPQASMNERLFAQYYGDVFAAGCDMSGLYDETIQSAARYFFLKLPHMMFIVDVVRGTQPFALNTHFIANNRDNALDTHIYNPHRLVLRRGGEALKLFELYSETDGVPTEAELKFDWTYVHDYYHPLPNQPGQGKEGSGLAYLWKSPMEGLKQIRVHSLAMDREAEIKKWHVHTLDDGFFRIEAPDPTDYLDLKLEKKEMLLRQPGQQDQIPLRV